MRKQARFNYANAYNAEQGILKYRVSPFPNSINYSGELIPLSKWCQDNFLSENQARTLIKKKCLQVLKMGGRLYVKLDDRYVLEDLMNESCRTVRQ